MASGQFAFLDCCSRELQSSQNVGAFQIWVIVEHVFDAAACCELAEDCTYGHTCVPDAGQPAHPVRVHSDPLVCHMFSLRPSRRVPFGLLGRDK